MDIKSISDFVVKSKDYLKDLDENLEAFKNSSDDIEPLNKMRGIMSTLKNMSINIAGFDNISKLAGNIENLLDGICKGEVKATPDIIDNLSSCVNDLKACIANDADGKEVGKAVINKLGSIINDKILSK